MGRDLHAGDLGQALGRTLAFGRVQSLRGGEPPRPFGESLEGAAAESWSPDGQALIYLSQGGGSFGSLRWGEETDPETILESRYELEEPQVSPNGAWLAYASRESGDWEVYVEPFRRAGERVRVSPDGGGQPEWRGDGEELFYVAPDGSLNAVAVEASADRLQVGLPVALFGGVIPDPGSDRYAVTRDGQRFLVVVPVDPDYGQRIHVLTDWTSLLE